MTNPTPLSPAALAIWEAFNQDEPGVFVDYGDKLAAALRAAADQVTPEGNYADELVMMISMRIRYELLAIADELEGANG